MSKILERIEEMARAGEISGQVRHYLLYGEHIQPEKMDERKMMHYVGRNDPRANSKGWALVKEPEIVWAKKKKFDGKINKSISYRAGKIAETWNLYRNGKFLKQVGIDKFREIQKRKRI